VPDSGTVRQEEQQFLVGFLELRHRLRPPSSISDGPAQQVKEAGNMPLYTLEYVPQNSEIIPNRFQRLLIEKRVDEAAEVLRNRAKKLTTLSREQDQHRSWCTKAHYPSTSRTRSPYPAHWGPVSHDTWQLRQAIQRSPVHRSVWLLSRVTSDGISLQPRSEDEVHSDVS